MVYNKAKEGVAIKIKIIVGIYVHICSISVWCEKAYLKVNVFVSLKSHTARNNIQRTTITMTIKKN
jgi:hypothetical protein